jgi:hypothetical protein
MSNAREIGYADDEEAVSYTWACARVLVEDGHFTIVTESGCSCNGPGDQGCGDGVSVGPAATLGGLFDELNVDKDKHGDYVKRAFIDALKTINDETIAAAKSALGLK